MSSYIPQIIYLVLLGLGLGITMINWGQPKKEPYGWSDIIGTLIIQFLLIWGGFYS